MAKRTAGTTDPMSPSMGLLCKLGSIVAHVEEGTSAGGHQFDWGAVAALLKDHDVQAWMGAMQKLALLPLKRR